MNYLSPIFNEQTFDDNGDPLVGGKIYTYIAGTSTPLATYTTQNGVTQQANPIILDARGEPTNPIWLGAHEYKFALYDASNNLIRTIDDVSGVNNTSIDQSEWISSALTPTYISATSFSFVGDQTLTFAVGRRLRTTNTGGTVYSTITSSSFGAGITTIGLINDAGVLDSGISAVAYGILAPSDSSVPNSQPFRQTMGIGYGIDIASAATLPLSTVTGEVVRVTGTTTTTAVTMINGQRIKCVAVGAWPLTYHATDLPLPGSANYTCSAGDMVIFTKNGNGDLTIEIIKKDGTAVSSSGVQIQPISASVGSNALTISASQLTLEFRSATLGSGTVTKVIGTPSNLVISSGSTLGTTSSIQSDIAVLAINNAGTIELAAVNVYGGFDLSETGLISTTAEGGAGAADSASVAYSTTARSNVAYRVLGIIRSTQATAGTWATAPSLIQGAGGNAYKILNGIALSIVQATTSGTSKTFTPPFANPKGFHLVLDQVSTDSTSPLCVRLGDSGGLENTGYLGSVTYVQNVVGTENFTTEYRLTHSAESQAAGIFQGIVTFDLLDPSTNTWSAKSTVGRSDKAQTTTAAGSKSLSDTLTQISFTTAAGTANFDGGKVSVQWFY